MATYFGRICAIEKKPSTVDEFNFWLARGCAEKVEVGYIVTAENHETSEKVFGLVTDIRFFTDAESVLVDYFSHEFGSPAAEPPTERQEIHIATASVIGSSPYRARPMSSGLVRLASAEEIHQAYGMDRIDNRIFCGVVTNGPSVENWAPAFMDEKFLLGPEGAHLNISGASGLATKTSAAIFLISSVLSAAKQLNKRYAVLAFNVKGGDLMRLDAGGEDGQYSQEELLGLIKKAGSAETKKMLAFAEESKVNLCFSRSQLKMFAPAKPNDISKPNSLVQESVKPFFWSLSDVIKEDAPVRLMDLFESEDIDDKSVGVLARIEELLDDEKNWKGKVTSFRELVQKMAGTSSIKGFWDPHHHSTVSKVTRLIRITCEGILNGLFAYDEETGKDIKIENIAPGELWVVDIEAINDRAKRLVFHNLTTRLANLMELETLKPKEERRLHGIIVFVDELNKFAPTAAAGNSKIKQQIIELAARGRSLGIILFGAEQFASRVDKEVIGNASSHFLGRTEIVELEDKAYGWLPKNLRFVVGNLEKGRLLLRHATYGRPVFMKFPQPLHNYSTVAIDELLGTGTEKPTRASTEADATAGKFDRLRKLLKERKGIHPIKIFDEVPGIKELGISQDHLSNWYHCWLSQHKFKGSGKTERKALDLILEYYSSH
jgi:hypothetical protein